MVIRIISAAGVDVNLQGDGCRFPSSLPDTPLPRCLSTPSRRHLCCPTSSTQLGVPSPSSRTKPTPSEMFSSCNRLGPRRAQARPGAMDLAQVDPNTGPETDSMRVIMCALISRIPRTLYSFCATERRPCSHPGKCGDIARRANQPERRH